MHRRREYCWVLCFLLITFYGCKKEYSYEGGPLSSGYCNSIVVFGTYQAGKDLNDSNFLSVELYASNAGSYDITSDTVNGFSFAGSGKVSDTGITQLHLAAHGKPLKPGSSLFTVRYDSSQCQVQVAVDDTLSNVIQTGNRDLFPLANDNVWSYDDLSYPRDSIIETIKGTTVLNSSTHFIMNDFISFFPANNESYYRKVGSDYFAYAAVSTFTDALDYAPTIYDDMNFLKDDCKKGDTWYTPIYTGRTALAFQQLQLCYVFRCVQADGTATINGKTFQHVYKIEMRPEVADVGAPLKATGEIHTSYYARGIGLIYRESFNTILTHPELQIRWWRVN
jgi:hypothetical protein